MLAERLKQLRSEKGITQIQLAEMLGVSKGTVAMWETNKRKPSFEILNELSDIFDRRMDYILGYSDDAASPQPADEDMDQMERWAAEDSMQETLMQYLQLDEYGKRAVEAIISAEFDRCKEQESLFPASNFRLNLRISK